MARYFEALIVSFVCVRVVDNLGVKGLDRGSNRAVRVDDPSTIASWPLGDQPGYTELQSVGRV